MRSFCSSSFFLLFFFSTSHVQAQGICDSTIFIYNPNFGLLCPSTDTWFQTNHPGGVFSGPGIQPNGLLPANVLGPGNYQILYTITGPGGCTRVTGLNFLVQTPPVAQLTASDTIDCASPGSTITLKAVHNSNTGKWYGPHGTVLTGNTVTTSLAGTYTFVANYVLSELCPATGKIEVPFQNMFPIHIVNCTNCDIPVFQLGIDTVPPITLNGWQARLTNSSGWSYPFPNCVFIEQAGSWQARVYNLQTGCISRDTVFISSIENPVPSVSAGSNLTLSCGTTSHILGAISSGGAVDFFWSTADGHFAGPDDVLYAAVDKPGTYVLHGTNLLTGCLDRDTMTVYPQGTTSPLIAMICAGDTLYGHTQTGSYVDTIYTHPDGCFEKKLLKLLVLPPIVDSTVVTPDFGQLTGTISVSIVSGTAPYTFQWSNGETAPFLSGLAAGNYVVTVTDASDCQLVSGVTVPLAFLADKGPTIDLRLFPNPSEATLTERTLVITGAVPDQAMLSVLDALGRVIFTRPVSLEEGENIFPLLYTFPAGIYSISLSDQHGRRNFSKMVVTGGK